MDIIKHLTIDEAFRKNKDSDRIYLAGKLSRKQPVVDEIVTSPPDRQGEFETGISEYETFTCEKPHVHRFNTEYNYVISGAVKIYLFDERREELLLPGDFFVIHPGEPYIAKQLAGTKVMFSKVPGGNDKELLKEGSYTLPEGWKDGWNEPKEEDEKRWYERIRRNCRYFGQAVGMNTPTLRGLLSAFGVVAVFSPLLSRWCNYLLIDGGFLLICALYFLGKVIYTFRNTLKKDKTVLPADKHKVIVMKDDFINNFKKILAAEDTMPLIVLGIDTTLDLELSTASGIIRGLTTYLSQHCGLKQADFQRYIDEAYFRVKNKKRERGKEALELEQMLFVKDVPLKVEIDGSTGNSKDPLLVTFLLVANSRKPSLEKVTTVADIERVEVGDHQRVISNIFSTCRKVASADPAMVHITDSLLMGAMGTNGGKVPYSVILSEILNSYEMSVRTGDVPHKLYISIRLEDIERQNFTQKEMLTLIRTRIKQMRY